MLLLKYIFSFTWFEKKLVSRASTIFFIALFISVSISQAQTKIKTFSENDAQFLEELLQVFESADKKDGRDFMDEFSVPWTEGKINAEQKKFIITTCNAMLKKRLRPFPEFKNFLGSIVNFVNGSQPAESYNSWQKSIEKLLNGKTITGFNNYCAMSEGLFKNNSFYKSATTEWRASSSDYKFLFDSVPSVVFGKTDINCYSKGDSASIYKTIGTYYPVAQ
jgi:hypothetical protein